MRSKVAWPVTNSRIRASNPLRVTGPTFRPKPRKIPRMLNSTSISRPRSYLRATSSARTSCDLLDLACAPGGTSPSGSVGQARAHLCGRSSPSLLTRPPSHAVSSKTASNSARFSPACSHCDNGPASSPIGFTAKPSASKKATRAAGSLEIFASFTILPRASTTQTTVPMTRRSLHSVPWLSSVSRCLGPTQRRDAVSSSIGGQPPQRSLAAGPITASSDSPPRHEPCPGRPNKTTPYIRRSPAAEKACRRGETPASGVRRPHPID